MQMKIAEQSKNAGKLAITQMRENISAQLTANEDAKMGGGGTDLNVIKEEYEQDLQRRNFDEKKAIES